MIKYLQIENFKSLKKIALPLENLNLFFGMNGMGKSSVMQSLLLLRQSFWENNRSNLNYLYTNGELIRLGTGRDIICQSADEEKVRFYIKYSNGESYEYNYEYDVKRAEEDQLERVPGEREEEYNNSLFSKDFYYLSAEHLGPKKQYSTEKWKKEGITQLGRIGEFVVPFLAIEGDKYRVPKNLCLEKGKTNRLIDQVSAWLSEISPGIKVTAELLPLVEKAKLTISYDGERLTSEPFLPVNVGFGIPYVLPLIVGLLISNENSLILIENPESHLHPKGQTMIAKLIALAAENGSQILCESHSDHIINGVRVAIKQNVIGNDKVTISYFDKNENQETYVLNIAVDCNGRLDNYPSGLLDEWGISMAELI